MHIRAPEFLCLFHRRINLKKRKRKKKKKLLPGSCSRFDSTLGAFEVCLYGTDRVLTHVHGYARVSIFSLDWKIISCLEEMKM